MKRQHSTMLAVGALCLFSCFRDMTALAIETTLYVGTHFEVRANDQPIKYVFNGSTRVARVTGSLSTNTRVQRFRLHAGWNLLSLAVSATNLSEQLQKPSIVASARAWDAQTGTYAPVPQVAASGTVLWVNATTNGMLSVLGAYSDPVNREVAAGATYLSGTGLEAWTPNFPASVAVWHFSPESSDSPPAPVGPWRMQLTGDLSAVDDLPDVFPPGQALYVINHAPFELEIPDPALRLRYYHQDHLGSSSVMTDAKGELVEETAFYPFGIQRHEHRLRQVEEAYKFTQKERDRESGLHYFQARYLAGGMSRFLSVDPMYANTAASTGDPQAMNLYAYVRNNPLQYTDPTGLEPAPSLSDIAHAAAVSDTRAAGESGMVSTVMSTMFGGVLFGGGLSEDANISAGFGDTLLDSVAPPPYRLFSGGSGVGEDARAALGINNVDVGSDRYDRGTTLGAVFSVAEGGRGVANAIKTGITAARTARAASAAEQEAAKLLKGRISAIAERAPDVNRQMDDFLKSLKGDGLPATDNWVQLGEMGTHAVPIPPKSFIELQDAFHDVARLTGMTDEALTKATGFSPTRPLPK